MVTSEKLGEQGRCMAAKNEDLHGNAPDKSEVALLLIDVINDMEFEGGAQLLQHALPMADNIATLKKRAREHDIPVVYVNDNFGKWQSDFKKTLEHVLQDGCRGKPVAEKLQPAKDDYFVLKPKHSGFFSTTLEILLEYLEVKIDPNRHCGKQLRLVHGKRRLHA